MKQTLVHLGNAVAVLGVLLCVASGVVRVIGFYYVLGFEVMTLYVGGMGLMIMACLAKLHLLSGARPTESS